MAVAVTVVATTISAGAGRSVHPLSLGVWTSVRAVGLSVSVAAATVSLCDPFGVSQNLLTKEYKNNEKIIEGIRTDGY